MKLIILFDPENEELVDFFWEGDRSPPPYMKPKVKKKKKKKSDIEDDQEKPS